MSEQRSPAAIPDRRWATALLACVVLNACSFSGPFTSGPGSCLPDRLPAPATTTHDGREVFVVQALEPDAHCYTMVQVGSITYVYTKGSDRTFRESEVDDDVYAVGGPGTEEIVEVRTVHGVPIEYALAARVEAGGWVALGGHPVENTEMEDERPLAERICGALQDRSTGWSFCQ